MPRPTRRALVVGIDYPGSPYELAGCVNDARQWMDYLRSKRFLTETLVNGNATRASILAALQDMLTESQPGDVCWFVYSGHGTNLRDLDGDEGDGRDEALCPVDFDRGRYIIDDDLRALFALHLKDGVSLTVAADCCHSGTIARLMAQPWRPRPDGARPRYIRPTPDMEQRHATDRSTGPVVRGMVPAAARFAAPLRWVTLSACHATEVAYESDGAGHFTTAALGVLRNAGATLTRAGFLRRVLAVMGDERAQTPQLDAPDGAERRALFAGSVAK